MGELPSRIPSTVRQSRRYTRSNIQSPFRNIYGVCFRHFKISYTGTEEDCRPFQPTTRISFKGCAAFVARTWPCRSASVMELHARPSAGRAARHFTDGTLKPPEFLTAVAHFGLDTVRAHDESSHVSFVRWSPPFQVPSVLSLPQLRNLPDRSIASGSTCSCTPNDLCATDTPRKAPSARLCRAWSKHAGTIVIIFKVRQTLTIMRRRVSVNFKYVTRVDSNPFQIFVFRKNYDVHMSQVIEIGKFFSCRTIYLKLLAVAICALP